MCLELAHTIKILLMWEILFTPLLLSRKVAITKIKLRRLRSLTLVLNEKNWEILLSR